MDRSEAYEACHQIMLENPNYVPTENSGVSYILLQVIDLPEHIGVHGHIINPNIANGDQTLRSFPHLSTDQQVVILGLHKATNAMKNAHNEINKLKQMVIDNNTSKEECIAYLERIFAPLKEPNRRSS